MNQLSHAAGKCASQLHGALECVARQVDHGVRPQRRDPFPELPALFFGGPIEHRMVDVLPAVVHDIRLPLTP